VINRLKKIFFILAGSIMLLVVFLFLVISPIAKYIIEKYDVKYTGREITTDWVYVNPFTGYVYLSNVKIYELASLPTGQAGLPTGQAGDSICLSANGLSIDMAMHKLFNKTYEISELTLTQPHGVFIQNKKHLNITDVIERFSSKDSTRAPVHFSILGIKIIDGVFQYREEVIPINYSIKNVNIESSGKRWNADTIAVQFSFMQDAGSGSVKGNFTINTKNKDYRYTAVVHQFDLNLIQQYLKDLTNYGKFSAVLEANLKSSGNFADQEAVTTSGTLSLHNFRLGKNSDDDYFSFDTFAISIVELSPKKRIYFYDSVSLIKPYLKYERYDSLDNLQRMFGIEGSKITTVSANPEKFNLVIEMVRYVKVISRNFFKSDYKIGRLNVSNANLEFSDFSINEQFAVELNPLNITADSLDKDNEHVKIFASAGVKPYGNLSIALSINPKDSSDFDMQYHLQGLPASLFNPYIITYTSFSLDRGSLEVKGWWHVKNGIIKSKNHLILLDPRTSKRLRSKDTKWVPLPLIMAFIRERGNVVDYDIPIRGDLKDPKFKLGDVFLDLMTNIFVKPPTTAYGLQVKNIESKIEKSLTLTWPFRNSSITPEQEVFIERMADFLKKNPTASIVVNPVFYTAKEKEHILYFESKKKYFQRGGNDKPFSKSDDDEVSKMFVKSGSFIRYLRKHTDDSTLFTIQERCARLIETDKLEASLQKLSSERQQSFLSYFKKEKVDGQVKFSKSVNGTPYNGFSFYKIEYVGEFPKSLLKAYRQMQELNDASPRKKFKDDRVKNVKMM
jgi:hypothetical protein